MKNILVYSTCNSVRSQMAEGLLRSLCGGRFQVFSAGSKPVAIPPEAVVVMKEMGVNIASHRAKHLDEFRGVNFDYVLTIGDESGLEFPANARRLHCNIEDPDACSGSEVERLESLRKIRDELRDYLEDFAGGSTGDTQADRDASASHLARSGY